MEFIKFLFTAILYVNALMALILFIFAYILLKRSKGNPIYFNFGMADLALALWMLVTLLDFFGITPFSNNFNARLGFFTGVWILHYFLIFTYHFLVAVKVKNYYVQILYIFTILISAMIFIPNFISAATVSFPFRYRTIDSLGLTIYISYFSFLAIASLMQLLKTFENSDGIHRSQLKKILIGSGIAIIANLIFSLINFYYTNFDLTHVGMFFALAVLIYIYSILFPKDLGFRVKF